MLHTEECPINQVHQGHSYAFAIIVGALPGQKYKCRIQRRDQTEVVQDSLLCWWSSALPLSPPFRLLILPFFLSPTLLLHVFKAVENQKKKKERHVCEGKEADGLACGKRTACFFVSPTKWGCLLCVFPCTMCGYNLLNPRHMTCSFALLSSHQTALECPIQANYLPWLGCQTQIFCAWVILEG